LAQNKAKLFKKFDHNIGFDKNVNFFAKNCQKSQKIVTITSVPGINVVNVFAKKRQKSWGTGTIASMAKFEPFIHNIISVFKKNDNILMINGHDVDPCSR
jgi:hypothetical protein